MQSTEKAITISNTPSSKGLVGGKLEMEADVVATIARLAAGRVKGIYSLGKSSLLNLGSDRTRGHDVDRTKSTCVHLPAQLTNSWRRCRIRQTFIGESTALSSRTTMTRTIGLFGATSVGVGAIVGGGIMVLGGVALEQAPRHRGGGDRAGHRRGRTRGWCGILPTSVRVHPGPAGRSDR